LLALTIHPFTLWNFSNISARYFYKSSLYLAASRFAKTSLVRECAFHASSYNRLFRIRQRCIMSGQSSHVGRAGLNLIYATLLLHVNLDISHRHRPVYSYRASSLFSPTSSISRSLARNEKRAQMIPLGGIYVSSILWSRTLLASVTTHFSQYLTF